MKTKRRPQGSGTVEPFRGKFRARLPDGKRTVLGVYDTPERAARILAAHMATATAPAGDTLETYGARWLDLRERMGVRGIDQERARWHAYVEPWECYRWPLRLIKRGDVRHWIDGLTGQNAAEPLADQTRRNALNTLRVCLRAAFEDEIIASNPALELRVHPRGTTKDTWDYLRPDEQGDVLRAADKLAPLVGLAMFTGLRWGEQRALELDDVHLGGDDPYLYVRRSGKGTTKSRRHRRVPLFGLGLAACQALQLDAVARPNPRRLLCLPERAEAYISKNGPRLGKILTAAGVTRHLRWHDLRHTCASSLVAGWWGRRWSLDEVRDYLGHSSITITERYAHLAGSIVQTAARETVSHQQAITENANSRAAPGIWTPDLRFTKPGVNPPEIPGATPRDGDLMACRLPPGVTVADVEADLAPRPGLPADEVAYLCRFFGVDVADLAEAARARGVRS